MASSIIHYAIASEILKVRSVRSSERFLLGAVLPDYGFQGNSHLKHAVAGGHKRTYDFEGFRADYGDRMKEDSLYLGYYLHLVQDILFRHFLYDRYHFDPTVPGNVEQLNADYSMENAYVIRKYALENTITVPAHFEDEMLNRICSFDLEKLRDGMNAYFASELSGKGVFFTEEMTDEFITEAAEFCLKEMDKLESAWNCTDGVSAFSECADSYLLAWDNMPKSLLETTLNTRDLGGYRIAATGKLTKTNRIYRSDVPKEPSERDISFLKKNGISTVIDLRLETEAAKSPDGLREVEGFRYFNYPNLEGSYIPDSVDRVPDSYVVIAESKSMSEVMRTIAHAPEGVLIHCTAGKDRTGVTSAVLLWLCGVSFEDIVYDYMITKITNKERFAKVKVNFPELDMNIVIPNEKNMYIFLNRLKDRYGTAEQYFASLGISESDVNAIKEKLCN